jgi:hypothetical protein
LRYRLSAGRSASGWVARGCCDVCGAEILIRKSIFPYQSDRMGICCRPPFAAPRFRRTSEQASRLAVKEPDHRHRRLLRACSDWPYGCCAAEKCDEIAASHTIEPHVPLRFEERNRILLEMTYRDQVGLWPTSQCAGRPMEGRLLAVGCRAWLLGCEQALIVSDGAEMDSSATRSAG